MIYLKNIFLFSFICLLTCACAICQKPETYRNINSEDEKIATDLLYKLKSEGELSMSEFVVKTGLYFLGTPYVAGTLEVNDTEELVVNLREMDCTTLVEYCLAFAVTLKSGSSKIDDFCQQLERIRYRNGKIDGYPSRLHYFSDWIFENDKHNLISDITLKLGGVMIERPIDFMSKHPDNYSALIADPVLIESIEEQEKMISAKKRWHIPKEVVSSISGQIEPGDIIAITTEIDGLDIIHTGIAVTKDGDIHLLHASTKEQGVVVSDKNLTEYLSGIKAASGIMIARPR